MEGYDQQLQGLSQHDFNTKRQVHKPQANEHIGITQRCIFELYSQLAELRKTERTSGRHYQVFCSYLQIYNEKVFDLLNQNTLSIIGNKKLSTAD
jgi:Kinesin motor domain